MDEPCLDRMRFGCRAPLLPAVMGEDRMEEVVEPVGGEWGFERFAACCHGKDTQCYVVIEIGSRWEWRRQQSREVCGVCRYRAEARLSRRVSGRIPARSCRRHPQYAEPVWRRADCGRGDHGVRLRAGDEPQARYRNRQTFRSQRTDVRQCEHRIIQARKNLVKLVEQRGNLAARRL